MEDLKKYFNTVEQGISLTGLEGEKCRTETEGQWNLRAMDKLELWMDLWQVEEEGRAYFQIMCPLVYIPENNAEAFLREMMELNYQMPGTYLVLYKTGVYLKYMKDADFLSPEEIALGLQRVATIGMQFAEGFVRKFNTSLLEHHEE